MTKDSRVIRKARSRGFTNDAAELLHFLYGCLGGQGIYLEKNR